VKYENSSSSGRLVITPRLFSQENRDKRWITGFVSLAGRNTLLAKHTSFVYTVKKYTVWPVACGGREEKQQFVMACYQLPSGDFVWLSVAENTSCL
jgi:hypothetical protein